MQPDYTKRRPTSPNWVKWIVHMVEGEAETEKIFYVHREAHALCVQHLRQGTCAYITTAECDADDIPF